MMFVSASHRKAQCGGEIFFISQHDVNVRSQAAIDFLRLGLPSNGFPKRCAVVQIIRDDYSSFLGRLHRFQCYLRSGLGECAEDSPSMEPPRAVLAKDLLPIDLDGLELGYGCVPAIGAAKRGANTKTAFREVQPIPNRAANSVIRDPSHILLGNAALQHEIFDEPSDGIVGQRGDDGSIESEAAPKSASDIVFTAAFPCTEIAGSGNTTVPRVETQHDLAQADQIPQALTFGFDIEL